MTTRPFARFAGLCAILSGIAGFLYAVAFIVLKDQLLYSASLLLVGLLASAALVGAYGRLRRVDEGFALWALILGLVGALGSAIHGGYDLANAINPPLAANPDLPSQIDPRGLLTFGVAAIALFVVSWLIGRSSQFPRGLAYLGYLSSILLLALYLGRLIVLSPANPIILVPALLNGFVVGPTWYLWLGLTLWRRGEASAEDANLRTRKGINRSAAA